MTIPQIHFGPYSLGGVPDSLKCGPDPIKLRPMSLRVLRYLSERPGRFISKEELLKEVWTGRVISDSGLRLCVGEIRVALNDDAKKPHYLETIIGEGYRFLEGAEGRAVFRDTPGPIVGRDSDLHRLEDCYRSALDGHTRFVLLAGEPGIGKTTLLKVFLERISAQFDANVIQGQCVIHHGREEAYGSLLEAIAKFCRGAEAARIIRTLEHHAPGWLLQLPELLDATRFERVKRQTEDIMPERMTREFCQLVETLTEKKPLIIVVEDLHWADVATIDLLASLAEHVGLALLILGTYRPAEAVLYRKSLRDTVLELKGRDHCREMLLELLTREDLASYLDGRLSGEASSELIDSIYRRSGGNPLFMVKLVEELIRAQTLVHRDGQWIVDNQDQAPVAKIPESLHSVILRQLEALPQAQKELLEVASVVGLEFSAAAMSDALEKTTEAVDRQLDTLWADGQFIEPGNIEAWPDGTLTGCYRFLHHLYLEVIYQQIGEVRQARLHHKVGERLESGYAERVQEIATSLAEHFDRGHDTERSLHYRKLAAEQALNRHAYSTAIDQLGKVLDKLERLPETAERNQQELEILLNLNSVRVATSGYVGSQLEQGYKRAQVLCELLNDPVQQFTVLWNIAGFRMARGELTQSRALIEQAAAVSHDLNDDSIDLMTDNAYAQQLLFEGAFAAALDKADSVVSSYDVERHATLASTYSEEDPGVTCAGIGCLASWMLGNTEQARERLQTLQHLSTQLNESPSTAWGLVICCIACQLHGDPQATLERADELIELSNRHAVHWSPVAKLFRAWAMFKLNPAPEQLEIARNCLGEWRAPGVQLAASYFLGLVAEMQWVLGELDQAQASVIEALALAENNGEYWIEAELHRLQGELMLAQDSKLHQEAEACFTRSLEVARALQARSLELRAALSLSQLWMQQGNSNAARQLLQPIIAWFGETSDNPDLRDAKALVA